MQILTPRQLLRASLFTLIMTCCTLSPIGSLAGNANSDSNKVIFVTSNGWHSGISLLKTDIPPDLLPEVATFPSARFIDFGRGDKTIYPTNRLTIYNTLRAALVPTPAVIHVVGLQSKPWDTFPEAEVISLPIGNQNFYRLVKFIDASFERYGQKRAIAIQKGLYSSSLFYPSKGSFHIFNTCNNWTARALVAGGFDISLLGTFSADRLMQEVRALLKSYKTNDPSGSDPNRALREKIERRPTK